MECEGELLKRGSDAEGARDPRNGAFREILEEAGLKFGALLPERGGEREIRRFAR